MPMTPMRVWHAIERAREGGGGLTAGAVQLNPKRRDQDDA
jgi:hypothetical protein